MSFSCELLSSILFFLLFSIEGVDPAEFDCVYSPAKRRGPVPGRSSQSRKSEMMQQSQGNGFLTAPNQQGMISQDSQGLMNVSVQGSQWNFVGQHQGMAQSQGGMHFLNDGQPGMAGNADIQQQLNLIQQYQQQQPNQLQQSQMNAGETDEPPARRVKVDESQQPSQGGGVPRTVSAHTHLLDRSDPEGSRLFSYYKMSIDELFRLPTTPTDEEYCLRLDIPGVTPRMIPGAHLAALSAARFAEAALGAMVHNEISLGMELCNAVVHCLRESVQEPVQAPVLLEVAKAYFLLGVFRACRGDMARYFKYRRVCMTYVDKLEVRRLAKTFFLVVSNGLLPIAD